MGYIGPAPTSGFISNAKERYTGITTAYVDLNHSISSLADVIVWVNYVKQDATNLTLTSSTRITLGATLVSADIVEVAYLGKAVATQSPAENSITNSMLAGSIANSKLANSSITLNGSAVSLGGSASVDNTPSFEAFLSATTSNISNDTDTLITFNTEVFDTDSKYDTSNGRFTPAVAGKYLLYGTVQILGTSTADSNENIVKLYKNGAQHMVTYWVVSMPQGVISWTTTVDFNTTDYMQVYAKINNSSGDRKIVGASSTQKITWFGGHKLIT